ncbi:MAG: ABC transporter substrate-binding protein [Betaproteobacteria bacterium]|nr:ABC transporter substrate-binding protein [Betaproteobacteria bacterium]
MKPFVHLLRPCIAIVAYALATTASAADTAGITDTAIKIGVMAPLTGSGSSYSKAEIGLDAYYKWVNDQGGVNGRKIETVLEDYACDSTKGIAAVKKLIHQDKVFMLHGNSCSAVAMAIKPVVLEAGIPWVIAHAANGAISSPATKNIFHGVPVGKTMGLAMGRFVMTKPGVAKVAVIQHTDDWAKSYCGPAMEFLASQSIKPVVEVALERGQTDATAQTLRIKQANPDFVIACLYEAETAIFLKDAKKFGLNAPVMGTAGTDLENTLKRVGDLDTVANYFVPHMYADNLDGPRLKRFVDILKKYYPSESVTAFSLISMGGGAAVVEALKRSGRDLSREKFIAELDKTRDFDTGVLAGRITWTAADRDGVKEVGIAGFVSGKPTVLKAWGQRL